MTGVPISDYKSLPKGWTKGRFKHLARIRNGQDYKRVEDQDGRYPVIGSGGEFARASAYLYDGESVLLGRKGTIDKPLYVNGRFWTVDTMFYTEIAPGNFPKFVYYLATTLPFDQLTTRTALPSMTQEALSNAGVVIPPYEEQGRIAAFLDHETARINELVHEQEQLISHLVVKKFSLTWNSVTGGDRSDRVSTAVEWLPAIPSNWKLAKLGYLVACLDSERIPLNAEERATMPGVVPYWGANGVVDYVARPLFDERLVLIGEDGAPFFNRTKSVAFVVDEPIWPNNHIHVLRPRDRSAEEAEWLASVLNVTDYMGFVEGATRDKLTQGRLMRIPIPVPPPGERDRLLARLRPSLIATDNLLKEARHMTDVLLERRSSLISAAVTGQLDLRNWRPPEPEAVAEVA